MSLHVVFTKVARSELRKVPLLPRLSFTIELGGRQLTIRTSPSIETLLNLRERGFNWKNLRRLAEEELSEIQLPALGKPAAVIKKGLAQVKSIKDKAVANAKPLRKSPAKAALKKRPDQGSELAPGREPAN